MKAAVFTLGCKVNQYESGAIVARLRELGIDADEGLFAADLYVINTCSVTAEADKKSRQTVSRALKFNAAAKIIIVGCSSQNDASRFFDRPEVTAVFGSGGKIQNITDAIKQLFPQASNSFQASPGAKILTNETPKRQNNSCECGQKKESLDKATRDGGLDKGAEKRMEQGLPQIYEDDMTPTQSKTRGHVKIQDGCDNFCSYCRVPYLRGRSRSRGEDAVIAEALRFARTSKEIVLTGIDISSYGKNNGSSLSRLVALLGAALQTHNAGRVVERAEKKCIACKLGENINAVGCNPSDNSDTFNYESDDENDKSGGNNRENLKCANPKAANNSNRCSSCGNIYHGGDAACGNINSSGVMIMPESTDLILKSDAIKPGSTRVRFGSLECGVISDDLLRAMKDYGFCDHFHLSLQSGSDLVLDRMNRHYSTAEFLDKIHLIRKYFPYAGITTDVIAGFPEESDEEHRQTAAFLQKVKFSDVHVFPYSQRKGTKAYALPQLDKRLREERARELSAIAAELKIDFVKKNLGRVCEVLAEDSEDGFVTGFTSNYIKVYTKLAPGEMCAQRLVDAFGAGARGENPFD